MKNNFQNSEDRDAFLEVLATDNTVVNITTGYEKGKEFPYYVKYEKKSGTYSPGKAFNIFMSIFRQ